MKTSKTIVNKGLQGHVQNIHHSIGTEMETTPADYKQ